MSKRAINYPTLLVFRHPAEVGAAVRSAADELGVTPSEYARRALAGHLARDGFAG